MGQHRAARIQQRRAQRTHAPVGGDILLMDRHCLGQQPRARIPADFGHHPLHAPQRPAQIDCGRARRRQQRQISRDACPPLPGTLDPACRRRQHHAIGRCDTNRRGAAHHHGANGLGCCRHALHTPILLLSRQQALIQQFQRIIAPAHGAHLIVSEGH